MGMTLRSSLMRILGWGVIALGFVPFLAERQTPAAETATAATAHPAPTALFTLCPRCELLQTETIDMPYLGTSVTVLHGWDEAKASPVELAVNEQGKVVDLESRLRADKEARWNLLGSLSPDLVGVLEISSAVDEIPVYLFATGMFPEQDRERIVSDKAYSDWYDAALAVALAKAQGGLVDALAERGYMVDYVVPEAPMVHAVLLRDDVMALARDPRIAAIDPDAGLGAPTSDGDWVYAMGLDAPHDWGWNGTNQRIGIIMTEQPLAGDSGQFIQVAGTASPTGLTRAEASWTVGTAKSLPAGMPAVPTRYTGAAPDARTYVANLDGWSGVGTVDSWAYNQGCRVLVYGRASSEPYFSTFSAHDRYVDYVTRQWSCATGCVHYIASAGNRNTLRIPWTTCGSTSAIVQNRFYNGLIVGGTDPGARTTWSIDDTMFKCPSQPADVASSWQNPNGASGRELPLVAAQAVDVYAGYQQFSGTSASASIVGGLVADVLERNTTLQSWPEALRAIVMATAWRDADGQALVPGDGVEDQDGAGIVSAERAVDLASAALQSPAAPSSRGWHADAVSLADFPGGWYAAYTPTVQVANGRTVRVALAWDATATCTDPNDPATCVDPVLDGNLNLYLRSQGGAVLRSSTSTVDGYEFLSYTNNSGATQNYSVAISLVGGFQGLGTTIGLAWDSANPANYFFSDVCNTTSTANRNLDVAQANEVPPYPRRGMPAAAAVRTTDYIGLWVRMLNTNLGKVYLQLFSKDGLPKLDAPKALSTNVFSAWPRVSAIDHDRSVVAWQQYPGTEWQRQPGTPPDTCGNVVVEVFKRDSVESYGSIILPDIDASVVPQTVPPTCNPSTYYQPDVAGYFSNRPNATPTQVGYWATWYRINDANTIGYIEAAYCALGDSSANCSAAIGLANFPTEEFDPFPAVGVFGQTSSNPRAALVAWVDINNGNVFGQCVSSGGALLGGRFTIGVGSDAERSERPAVASLGDSSVVVAWIDGNNLTRYRRYAIAGNGLSCNAVDLTERQGCGGVTWPYRCTDNESKVWGESQHTRIGLATNGNAGNPQIRLAYSRESGANGPIFAARRIDPNIGFVSHTDLPDFGNNGNEAGGAIASLPECGLDWFAMWGACTNSGCITTGGNTRRIDTTTRAW